MSANPSEPELSRQHNTELEIAELEEVWRRRLTLQEVKIAELNSKNGALTTENFDLKNENARLRRELESRIDDHESRLAKVEQRHSGVGEQLQNGRSKEMISEISNVSNSAVDQLNITNTKTREASLVRNIKVSYIIPEL